MDDPLPLMIILPCTIFSQINFFNNFSRVDTIKDDKNGSQENERFIGEHLEIDWQMSMQN